MGSSANSDGFRFNRALTLGGLGVAVAVFASSMGLGSSLTGVLSRQVQAAAKAMKPGSSTLSNQQQVKQQMAKMPMYFIENQGQMDPKVSHYLQGAGTSVYFTSEGLTYAFSQAKADQPPNRYALKLDFVGANRVAPISLNETDAKISYFKGSPDQWKSGASTSSKLAYSNLWPGIDLVYSGTGQKLKYDFHVAPGADPSKIKLAYRGADSVSVDKKGRLKVDTPQGPVMDDRPVSYQLVNGKRMTVKSSYALSQGPAGAGAYGFSMGKYDRSKPLVIDPAVFLKLGFIGGDLQDLGEGIAVDTSGAAYVTGVSPGGTFPASAGVDNTPNGGNDAFLAKVNSSGTALVYAAYVGGSGDDLGIAVGVDAAGAAYITGTTDSTELSATPFPVVVGPDLTQNGGRDIYITKVNPAGTGIAYSGFIGGTAPEIYNNNSQVGLAVSPAGNAYLTGAVQIGSAASFPVAVGPDLTQNGNTDAFVAKVNLSGSALDYSGFIGGSGQDSGWAVAVDAAGAAYVTGFAESTEATFPDSVGPDLTNNGSFDGFVAKVAPDGTGLTYAGYIGGTNSNEIGRAIAVDSSGAAYVAGMTNSLDGSFPVKIGPDLTPHTGGLEGFISKVSPDGSVLAYSGFLTGEANDTIYGIAVDSAGSAYVSGETQSAETSSNPAASTFPVTVGPDLTYNSGTPGGSFIGSDAFVAKVNPPGIGFDLVSYIGGEGPDIGRRVAVDSAGDAYIVGSVGSDEVFLPVTGGPDLTYNGGPNDAFLAKVSYTAPIERTANFIGNASTDVALYRGGTWYFQAGPAVSWGGDPTDRTVPADYNGDGTTDIAVYRASTGTWWVKDQFSVQWGGNPSDIPVPGDYNGDGKADLAVYRNGTWFVKNIVANTQFEVSWGGDPSDIPVPGDYDDNGVTDIAVYRKSTGSWYLRNFLTTNPNLLAVQWGGDGTDVPVPGDYNGDGGTDLAVYRKSIGTWFVKNIIDDSQTEISWGGDISDVPVPGDYDNNGTTDRAVYRKDTGYWYVKDQFEQSWGGDPSDKALPLPSAIRD